MMQKYLEKRLREEHEMRWDLMLTRVSLESRPACFVPSRVPRLWLAECASCVLRSCCTCRACYERFSRRACSLEPLVSLVLRLWLVERASCVLRPCCKRRVFRACFSSRACIVSVWFLNFAGDWWSRPLWNTRTRARLAGNSRNTSKNWVSAQLRSAVV